MSLKHFPFESLIVIHGGKPEISPHGCLPLSSHLHMVDETPVAPAIQLTLQLHGSLFRQRIRQNTFSHLHQKGVPLKSVKPADMEGTQLGHGLDQHEHTLSIEGKDTPDFSGIEGRDPFNQENGI